MLRIKRGVSLLGIKPEMVVGIQVCNGVFAGYTLNCVITSGTEGKHGPHSHHHKGLAVDFRSRHIPPESKDELVAELVQSLSGEFQVVVESRHIHVEYDPA